MTSKTALTLAALLSAFLQACSTSPSSGSASQIKDADSSTQRYQCACVEDNSNGAGITVTMGYAYLDGTASRVENKKQQACEAAFPHQAIFAQECYPAPIQYEP